MRIAHAGSTAAAVAAAAAQKVATDNPLVVRLVGCCSTRSFRVSEPSHDTLAPAQVAGLSFAYPQIFKKLFAPAKVRQRFFPQCNGCSQARTTRTAVRNRSVRSCI